MIVRDATFEELSELAISLDEDIIITGDTALSKNHLIYDMTPITVLTKVKGLDRTPGINYMREFYHFRDLDYTSKVADRVYLLTPEKAILDTIVWLPENTNEGALIEALQTYQENNDKSKLYEVADHYKVPHEFVDYWWKEAEEESDMSMG